MSFAAIRQQAVKSQYQLSPSTDNILQLHVTSSVCLHHLFNIFVLVYKEFVDIPEDACQSHV